jgi:hypothetical protein
VHERTAAGQHDPVLEQVGGEVGRRLLEDRPHGADDRVERVAHRLADQPLVDGAAGRAPGVEVGPGDGEGLAPRRPAGVAAFHLEALGGERSDREALVVAQLGDDRGVERVAADLDRTHCDDAAQREDGDLGRPAADVDDHPAARRRDVHPRADRRGDRLRHEDRRARTGGADRLFDRFALDVGRTARDASDDARRDPRTRRERAIDHRRDERVGAAKIGDRSAAQRAHDVDAPGCPAVELFGRGPDRDDRVVGLAVGHHRRLAHDDAGVALVDDRVGGAEIDPDVGAQGRADRGGDAAHTGCPTGAGTALRR